MVSKEEISNLNKHILSVSGTSTDFFGFTNEGNLDYAVSEAKHQENSVDKATILMHEIIRGQPFTNGNKRTGFETGKSMLESEGYVFTANPEEVISFTNSINIKGKSREEVKKWLVCNSEFSGGKGNFVNVSGANVIKDIEMLKRMD